MIARPDIDRQLDAFLQRHPEEQAVGARVRELVERSAAPCSRQHYAPGHLTASACVLSPAGDAVLLVHHGKLDRWLQPGGHIEADDVSLLAAAQREVLEECGLAVSTPLGAPDTRPIDIDIHPIPARGTEPEHLHFDIRYGFLADPRAPLAVSAESHAVRWFGLDELDGAGSDASVHRMVARCRIAFAN